MSRECEVTGKKPMSGNNVSHANNRTKRLFRPNLQVVRMYSEKLQKFFKLRVSMHGLRTVEHNGGLDGYVGKRAKTKLSSPLRKIKKEIEAAEKSAPADKAA